MFGVCVGRWVFGLVLCVFYYRNIINDCLQMTPRGSSEIPVFLVRIFVVSKQTMKGLRQTQVFQYECKSLLGYKSLS